MTSLLGILISAALAFFNLLRLLLEKADLAHPDVFSFFDVASTTATRLNMRFVGMAARARRTVV
jgi:hypothetical protein